MARQFRAAPDDDQISFGDVGFLDNLAAVTFSAWVYVDAFRTNDEDYVRKSNIFSPMQRDGGNSFYRVVHWVNGSLDYNTTFFPTTTTGQWQHYLCRWASGGPFQPYLDGTLGTASGNKTGSFNTSVAPLILGQSENGNEEANGRIAELAFWDVSLSDGERLALTSGFSPALVRPSSLIFYAPLIGRNSPETDIIGGESGTLTGTVAISHPPIIYPTSQQIRRYGGAAADTSVKDLLGSGIVVFPR